MTRGLTFLGAPSAIGIRPYDDGRPRRLDLAPVVMRELELPARLGAGDAGDVLPRPYRDFTRTPGRVRNEPEVLAYSLALADRVEAALAGTAHPLTFIMGGDCSIVLGALHGARLATGGAAVGLAYIDAHADFATPAESATGSAASMCLAMAVGRGDSPLARLGGDDPLVDARHVALIGRRDHAESRLMQDAIARSGMLDIPDAAVRASPSGMCHAPGSATRHASIAARALERLAAPELAGFWIHVDADVLDPAVMPSVDSPLPGGLSLDDAEALLAPLVRHPKAMGMHISIYDPQLDHDRRAGARLATLLARVLGPVPDGVAA